MNTEDNNYIYWDKDRVIGEISYTTDGRLAEIIDIGPSGQWNDLTLLYGDGSIEKHQSIYYFGGYVKANNSWTYRRLRRCPVTEYLKPDYFGFEIAPGRMKRQKNGLIAKVIPRIMPPYTNTVTIEWEDGEVEEVKKYSYINGTCKRKDLQMNEIFHGFVINKMITKRNRGKAYYEATCLSCKQKNIFTPQQMMEHSKEHKND